MEGKITIRHPIKNGPAKGGFVEIRSDEKTLSWHPYPWMFSVILPDGTTHDFCGVPNYCGTKHHAFCRAHAKARQLLAGKYSLPFPFLGTEYEQARQAKSQEPTTDTLQKG